MAAPRRRRGVGPMFYARLCCSAANASANASSSSKKKSSSQARAERPRAEGGARTAPEPLEGVFGGVGVSHLLASGLQSASSAFEFALPLNGHIAVTVIRDSQRAVHLDQACRSAAEETRGKELRAAQINKFGRLEQFAQKTR